MFEYFNFLTKLLIKYDTFQLNYLENQDNINNNSPLIKFENSNLSKDQILKFYYAYDKIIKNSQQFINLQLNSQLFLITKEPQNWLVEMSNFSFLKKQIKSIAPKLNNVKQLTEFKNLRPTIYFSVSLKEQLKYVFGKNKLTSKPDRH